MKITVLNRQFHEPLPMDRSLLRRLGFLGETLSWEDLLKNRRVVILAEGGSGKTREMQMQSKLLTDNGRFAVFAALQDVGRLGLRESLVSKDQTRFDHWMKTEEAGWFFIDSIDEALRNTIALEWGLLRIADAIGNSLARAYVVLSCRPNDWQDSRDLRLLCDSLPIPPPTRSPEAPTPTSNEQLLKFFRHQTAKELSRQSEKPMVVVMCALDPERVATYAKDQGVTDVDAFLADVKAGNWWHLAGRPLDLDWLVLYWQKNRRLGSYREMLELSLRQRLQEQDPDKIRQDALNPVAAFAALERIGAALVFSREETIAVPDSERSLGTSYPGASLLEILPDWSNKDRADLFSRAVFEPGLHGRTQLHNDNLGTVRAYLAARWLQRQSEANLSRSQLFDFLFVTTYDQEVIRPSRLETATWFAGMDRDVAQELIHRDPFALMSLGDPGSLTADLRQDVLEAVVSRLAHRETRSGFYPNADQLTRFSKPDLVPLIRSLWTRHSSRTSVVQLLLHLIGKGCLTELSDLVVRITRKPSGNEVTDTLGVRALLVVGDTAAKQAFAERIPKHLHSFYRSTLWEALEGLFPQCVSIADLVAIIKALDEKNSDVLNELERSGPQLVRKLRTAHDVELLLSSLLDLLGGIPGQHVDIPSYDPREECFAPGIRAAAQQLLELVSNSEAPESAIDAFLRVGDDSRSRQRISSSPTSLSALLHGSLRRRQLSFWRAAERLDGHALLRGRAIESTWELGLLGYPPGLRLEDIDWLLEDGPSRPTPQQRRLAIRSAIDVWQANGRSTDLLGRIRSIASADTDMAAAFDAVTQQSKSSDTLKAHLKEAEDIELRNAAQLASHDKAWTDFFEALKSDPSQLDPEPPTNPPVVNGRLYWLWHLLELADSKNRYAIDNLKAIEPYLGAAICERFRAGLSAHWRAWKPRPDSQKPTNERNNVRHTDCMGLVGISLEAALNPRWAESLSPTEAERAAEYGTIEIVGFPNWMVDLAVNHPSETRSVLVEEVRFELDQAGSLTFFNAIGDLNGSDLRVKKVAAPACLALLQPRDVRVANALQPLLALLEEGLEEADDRAALLKLARARFEKESDAPIAALYLGTIFGLAPDQATALLRARLRSLKTPSKKTELVAQLLPDLFGGRLGFSRHPLRALPFECLVELVEIAYETVQIKNDNNRPEGQAYSPDQRDHAEGARGTALNLLAGTPGRATYKTLLRLAKVESLGLPAEVLHQHAQRRVLADSEQAPWPLSEPQAFEVRFQSQPSNGKDLQSLALLRLRDLQHELSHGDFGKAAIVRSLRIEEDVQKWVADHLRMRQGRSYSTEREPEVAEKKRPDIRLYSRVSEARVAIEIKVAEDWSLPELEAALRQQLCRQYLRDQAAQYGILLLVHKKRRTKGWNKPGTRKKLLFEQVVAYLRSHATRISEQSPFCPQPAIAVLDVSQPERRIVRKAMR